MAVSSGCAFYYALLVTNTRLFGALWFLHSIRRALICCRSTKSSTKERKAFMNLSTSSGPNEGRLSRVASKVETSKFQTVRHFKNTHTIKGKAEFWFIYDESFNELRRTRQLTVEERTYPLFHMIDDILMCKLIDRQWTPERDERI